ncbi:uncharacterized protein LOC111080621 [Drosophila obscura]|uniref:uncharacterized protein LOC111080621 n=1 Tax=Drosophila obscura TaxID=7282 RepID=UPI001BB2CCF1|nr:uncharacterized protein LOC111080621 [Drosophila obscura]
MHITFEILSFLLLPILLASGEMQWDCDYSQAIHPGESYYFRNPNWPNNYPSGSSCRLKATTAWASNKLEIKCNMDIPKDKKGCINHRIVVSTYVDEVESPRSTQVYCGKKEFTKSIIQPQKYSRIYAEFTSNGNKTGRFSCTLSNKGPQS